MLGNFTRIIVVLVYIFCTSFLDAQKKTPLELKVFNLNNEMKYKESEKLLLPILHDDTKTKAEKYEASLLLSYTYKRLFDYDSVQKYLDLALSYADKKQTNQIIANKAMAFFDITEYKKSHILINELEAKNYENVNDTDVAILLMQQGYLHFLEKDYATAEKNYKNSLLLMKKNKDCNEPIVYGKMFELYAKTGRANLIESLYKESVRIAKECNILKYEIYAADEYYKTLVSQKNFEKAIKMRKVADSLNVIFNTGKNLSELHQTSEEITTKKFEETLSSKIKWLNLSLGFVGWSTITLLILSYLTYKYHKKRKEAESQYENIKLQLDDYVRDMSQKEQQKLDSLFLQEKFSGRQREILELLQQGMKNNEIADKLFISENTVKFHIKNIYKVLKESGISIDRKQK